MTPNYSVEKTYKPVIMILERTIQRGTIFND